MWRWLSSSPKPNSHGSVWAARPEVSVSSMCSLRCSGVAWVAWSSRCRRPPTAKRGRAGAPHGQGAPRGSAPAGAGVRPGGTSATPSFRMPTIWLSVNRDFRMATPSKAPESPTFYGLVKGEAYLTMNNELVQSFERLYDHRTGILEGVRLVAFRNIDHLARAMAAKASIDSRPPRRSSAFRTP